MTNPWFGDFARLYFGCADGFWGLVTGLSGEAERVAG